MTIPEDSLQALCWMIDRNAKGLTRKALASMIWPTAKPETAHSKLDRALSLDGDLNLDFRVVKLIMDQCDREDILVYYLEARGYDSTKLVDIRRRVKSKEELLESIALKLDARAKEDQETRAILKLVAEESGEKSPKPRSR